MKTDLRRYQGQGVFLAAALLLAVLALGLTRAGRSVYSEFADQMGRYRLYRALQREAGKADSLSLAYAGLQRDLRDVHAALPADNPSSHVLNILVEGARQRDLGISGITGLDEVSFPGFRELPFDLALSGRFADLAGFLHSLETRGMVLR